MTILHLLNYYQKCQKACNGYTLFKIYKLTVDDENVFYVYNYDIDYDV